MIEKDNVSLIQRIENEVNMFYKEINNVKGTAIKDSDVSKDNVLSSTQIHEPCLQWLN